MMHLSESCNRISFYCDWLEFNSLTKWLFSSGNLQNWDSLQQNPSFWQWCTLYRRRQRFPSHIGKKSKMSMGKQHSLKIPISKDTNL